MGRLYFIVMSASEWNHLITSVVREGFDDAKRYLSYKDQTTVLGSSPLHFAMCGDDPDMARLLLEEGVPVDSQNQFGESPIHWCCKLGTVGHLRALLEYGARWYLRDGEGNTPLHWAAEYDRPDICLLLLRMGASLDACNHEGLTPLQLAKLEGASRVTLDLLGSRQ